MLSTRSAVGDVAQSAQQTGHGPLRASQNLKRDRQAMPCCGVDRCPLSHRSVDDEDQRDASNPDEETDKPTRIEAQVQPELQRHVSHPIRSRLEG
jgi:hypothetical protein